MKVLFLDFDGVLNSIQYAVLMRRRGDDGYGEAFDPLAVSNLLEVLDRVPDLKIVVSSAWRLGDTVEGLRDLLSKNGIPAERIIDKTANQSQKGYERGYEIQDWLEAHPEVTEFAIVDDDSDMLESQKERFVHTSYMHGLIWGDALQLCRLFGVDTRRG